MKWHLIAREIGETTAKDYAVTSQAYMKRELNKHRAQSTKIALLSVEIKSTNQNITGMKSTVKSLQGKVRAKKLRENEEWEGKIKE